MAALRAGPPLQIDSGRIMPYFSQQDPQGPTCYEVLWCV